MLKILRQLRGDSADVARLRAETYDEILAVPGRYEIKKDVFAEVLAKLQRGETATFSGRAGLLNAPTYSNEFGYTAFRGFNGDIKLTGEIVGNKTKYETSWMVVTGTWGEWINTVGETGEAVNALSLGGVLANLYAKVADVTAIATTAAQSVYTALAARVTAVEGKFTGIEGDYVSKALLFWVGQTVTVVKNRQHISNVDLHTIVAEGRYVGDACVNRPEGWSWAYYDYEVMFGGNWMRITAHPLWNGDKTEMVKWRYDGGGVYAWSDWSLLIESDGSVPVAGQARSVADGNYWRFIPIGFEYVQRSGRVAPSTLFGGGTWSNVSSEWAGRFERIEGGNAVAYGSVQADAIRDIQGSFYNAGLKPQGSSQGYAGAFAGTSYITGNTHYGQEVGGYTVPQITFKASSYLAAANIAAEIRPVNSTIRVWRLTAY